MQAQSFKRDFHSTEESELVEAKANLIHSRQAVSQGKILFA